MANKIPTSKELEETRRQLEQAQAMVVSLTAKWRAERRSNATAEEDRYDETKSTRDYACYLRDALLSQYTSMLHRYYGTPPTNWRDDVTLLESGEVEQ